MTRHLVPRHVPPLQHAEQQVNAVQPSGTALRRVAEGHTYVACRQKKLIALRCFNLRDVSRILPLGPVSVWPTYFRTGENTNALEVRVGMVKTFSAPVSPASVSVLVKTPAGVIVNQGDEGVLLHDGEQASTTASPADISHYRSIITGLDPDTEYRLEPVMSNRAQMLYLFAREAIVRQADDSVLGVSSPARYPVGGPIYDADVASLIASNNALIKHNRAHYLSWCCDYEAVPTAPGVPLVTTPEFVAGAWGDLDGVEHFLPVAYHTTRRRTTIPVRLAVLAERTVGAGTLSVGLYNGSTRISVTGIGAGSRVTWTVVTASLPAADDTWRIQWNHPGIQGSGGTTHAIYGVSLFPYEA